MDDAISRLVRLLVGVVVVALVAATVVSWWLIRRSLRPVDRMVDTAATIAAGDLSQRVIDADPRTELGRLGRALNEMLHQVERAVAPRRQRATAAPLRRGRRARAAHAPDVASRLR